LRKDLKPPGCAFVAGLTICLFLCMTQSEADAQGRRLEELRRGITTGKPEMSSIYPSATPEIARRRRDSARILPDQ